MASSLSLCCLRSDDFSPQLQARAQNASQTSLSRGGSYNALQSLTIPTTVTPAGRSGGGGGGSSGMRENRDSFNSLIAATMGVGG